MITFEGLVRRAMKVKVVAARGLGWAGQGAGGKSMSEEETNLRGDIWQISGGLYRAADPPGLAEESCLGPPNQ